MKPLIKNLALVAGVSSVAVPFAAQTSQADTLNLDKLKDHQVDSILTSPNASYQDFTTNRAALTRFGKWFKDGRLMTGWRTQRQWGDSAAWARVGANEAYPGELKNKDVDSLLRMLPMLTPQMFATCPDTLVSLGIWDKLPRGLDALHKMSPYQKGSQVLIEIDGVHPVFKKGPSTSDFSAKWDNRYGFYNQEYKGKTKQLTHRGVIVEEQKKHYVVEVDDVNGGKKKFKVKKEWMHYWNDASALQDFGIDASATEYSLDGLQIDLNDPVLKGKLMQTLREIRDLAGKLDFTRGFDDKKNIKVQKKIVDKIFHGWESKYKSNKAWEKTDHIANRLLNGAGHCWYQSRTQIAFFMLFKDLVGLESMWISGKTHRDWDDHSAVSTYPSDKGGGHNFLILRFKNGSTMYVSDKTWKAGNEAIEVNKAMANGRGRPSPSNNRRVIKPHGYDRDKPSGRPDVKPL